MKINQTKAVKEISEAQVNKVLRWYAKQSEHERIIIHNDKLPIFRRLVNDKRSQKSAPFSMTQIDYQALVYAIYNRMRLHCGEQDNRRDLEAVEKVRIETVRNEHVGKPSPVRDKLMGDLMPTIQKLRETEGLTWSAIAKYLAKYHKKRISVGYLHRVYTTTRAAGLI